MSAAAAPAADMISADLLALAGRLADAAGAVVRRHFRQPVAVDDKADASPVTIADRDAETAIRALLRAERPGDGIVGEEHGSAGADNPFVWVIDPIDGTKSFITGRPTFVTLIALLHRGRPVLGVIDQPVIGERWVGGTGHPSRFNGQPVRTRPCPSLDRAVLNATSPEMFQGDDQPAFGRLRDAVKLTTYGGDGYAYGLLASGFIDLIAEADLKLYDFAALVPVIEGAGGRITDWQGRPAGPETDGRVLASGDPALHAAALARLRGD